VSSWPLTANGKLDRRGLPTPSQHDQPYRAPRNLTEETLCKIFAELLAVDRVGIDDNFFVLGGHSLTAIRLVNRVAASLRVPMSLRTVFQTPTVAELAASISVHRRTVTRYANASAVKRNPV